MSDAERLPENVTAPQKMNFLAAEFRRAALGSDTSAPGCYRCGTVLRRVHQYDMPYTFAPDQDGSQHLCCPSCASYSTMVQEQRDE